MIPHASRLPQQIAMRGSQIMGRHDHRVGQGWECRCLGGVLWSPSISTLYGRRCCLWDRLPACRRSRKMGSSHYLGRCPVTGVDFQDISPMSNGCREIARSAAMPPARRSGGRLCGEATGQGISHGLRCAQGVSVPGRGSRPRASFRTGTWDIGAMPPEIPVPSGNPKSPPIVG